MSENLVSLTIDGIELSVPKGTLVVDAAKMIDNNIPVFCYHPKMEPVGMCRMCLVEIGMPMRDRATGELMTNEDGSPKLNFGRGLQTACTVQVGPGMVVRTTTDVVDEAREDVIEFLLTSHPLDCPICDKGGECPLQNLTMEHGKGETRMEFSDKKKMDKHVPLGELIYLDRERCIQCARCTRFQDEIVDDPVIGFHNRGRSLEIVTLSDPGFDSYWSGNTTDICPVGALTTADFRFGARPWELTPVASVSPHGPAGSNLTFSTRREAKSGGRSVIKRVMPRQNEQVNEIWISDRDRFVHHFADAPDRLKRPLIRKNGQLTEASWDEALTLVAEKLDQHKTAVAGLSGDRVSNEDLFAFQKLLRQTLNSNHLDLANRRLGGGEVVAKVGLSSESNLGDLGDGDAILVVASDLHEEEPIWWLRVKQATERGAKLVLLNLRSTRLNPFASCVIQYAPGEALQTVQQVVNAAKVEMNGDEKTAAEAAAEMLIQANNLVVFYGSEGLTYAETDTLAKQLGNLLLIKNEEAHAGKPNNGLIPVWPHNNTQGAWDVGVHPELAPGYKPVNEPGMSASDIYTAVSDGSLNALYIMGCDPVGDGLMADRGKLDFLVVQELFLTKTAVLADVVLPAQSWAEREGTFTSGERRVQRYYQAIQPVGESRPDWQILAQVGEKLGKGKPAFAASLAFRDLAKAVPQYKGMDYRTLARTEKQWPDVSRSDLYYGGTSYENRSGLGQRWLCEAETGDVAQFEVDVPQTAVSGLQLVHTVALYTPGTLNGRSAVLKPRLAQPTVALNSEDAVKLGVSSQDTVKVTAGEHAYEAVAHVNGVTPVGVALIRGVPVKSGTAVVDSIEKIG
jgi:NADH-quinone oxidoreductase subunit G